MSRFAGVTSSLSTMLGLIRPNRFYVQIDFLGRNALQAESVDFPAMAIGTADLQYNTQPILKIPYAKLPAQTCNITFRLDKKGEPLKSFYDYVDKIVSRTASEYFIAYPEEIWHQIKITALDNLDRDIYSLTLYRCMISNIDTAQYSFDDRDSYQKQTVTFSYQDAVLNMAAK